MDENTDQEEANGIPKEVKDLLAHLQTAAEMAEPAQMLADAVKEMELGKKAGELLDVAVGEIVEVLRPVIDRVTKWYEDRRERRLAFMKKATGKDHLSEGIALEILKLEHAEHVNLMKTIEVEVYKWQAKNAEIAKAATEKQSAATDLVSNLLARTKGARA